MLVEYARDELARIGGADDDMQKEMNSHILRMVETFADEGHSGFSASYAIGALEKLLRFEPLTPLTGEPDEWVEVADSQWQNKRCGRVFKDAVDGPAYDIDAVVFREPDGACFTSRDSRREVTFPYTPKTEYMDVPADR